MKIALVGTTDSPIKKDAIGGTEMWTYNLAEKLKEKGHEVTLFAASGSNISGKFVQTIDAKYFKNDSGMISFPRYSLANIDQVVEVLHRENEFDVIHFCLFPFYYVFPLLSLFQTPTLITIHGYNDFNKSQAEKLMNQNTTIAYVSQSFADNWPNNDKTVVIKNGVQVSDFQFSEKVGKYFFWMGRLSKDKNIMQVLEFAKKSSEKMVIAGPIRDKHLFNNEIKPFLGCNIEYVGELNYEEKKRYYREAKAFVFPIKIKEPLPLVVLESLGCGTPILTFDVEPMPELVVEGETGFIVEPDNIDDMVYKSKKINSLNRYSCRKFVEDNFSLDKMIDEYEDLYQKVV